LYSAKFWVKDEALKLKNQGYGRVLPGQGYHIPQEAIIQVYEAMVTILFAGEPPSPKLERNLLQYYSVQH
jgi:hypothetical protein